MSYDSHLVWHVVGPEDCVVGAWGIEERAAEQASDVGGYYLLVMNVVAGWGPKESCLTYAPKRPVGERLVLRHVEAGRVTYEHKEWPKWAALLGVERRSTHTKSLDRGGK